MLDESASVALLIIFVVAPIVVSAIICSILIPINVRNKKYLNFVIFHSISIEQLKALNATTKFFRISNFDRNNKYDNVDFYKEISCLDYLIYELVYIKKDVDDAIESVLENRRRYKIYTESVNKIRQFGKYDCDIGDLKIEKLIKMESRYFYNFELKPTTQFSITVRLTRTNINGDYQESKRQTFNIGELTDLIERINNKRGNYYLDGDIWASICRVERGKVSNKLRFFIFNRDHNRCKICGSRSNLEVDHIYPIAKGGKTTLDNLQTLCHRCNYNKGDKVQ